jgi:UDP-2,3-diacylglucosamine pyrophosphatase LpxH
MPGRFKIVVSDLHLGAGYQNQGNRLEDFDQDEHFAALLKEIAAESDRDGAEVELIINGDAFEMLQVPHLDDFEPKVIYAPQQYHSSSEADSARKMSLIIDGHPVFFHALRHFAQTGPPARYLTFIKGNHDVNLHWQAVQQRIREAVGAVGDRASLLIFEERRVSREGIYVEHGNQYAAEVDRIEDMDEPHDHDKPGQLAIPSGSWFVMDVFNQVERERYWIDGIKPITALVWYALAYDFAFAARAIATLIRALPGILSETVRDVEGPEGQAPGSELLHQLENPAMVEELAGRYETDEAFRAQFNAEVAAALSPAQALEGADAAPRALAPDPVAVGEGIQAQVRSSLFEIARVRALEERVKLVTFGHTHEAGEEPFPEDGLYINSGTWTWTADFSAAGDQTWLDLFDHPERFTDSRKRSYVRIDYDEEGQPSGRLMTYEPPTTPQETVEEEEARAKPEGKDTEPQAATAWNQFLTWLQGLWA